MYQISRMVKNRSNSHELDCRRRGGRISKGGGCVHCMATNSRGGGTCTVFGVREIINLLY